MIGIYYQGNRITVYFNRDNGTFEELLKHVAELQITSVMARPYQGYDIERDVKLLDQFRAVPIDQLLHIASNPSALTYRKPK